MRRLLAAVGLIGLAAVVGFVCHLAFGFAGYLISMPTALLLGALAAGILIS